MAPDPEIRVHTTADREPDAGQSAREGHDAPPRPVFPASAEPLTAWRVDLAVLVGVSHHHRPLGA